VTKYCRITDSNALWMYSGIDVYSRDNGFSSRMSLSFSWVSILASSLKMNDESNFQDRLSITVVLEVKYVVFPDSVEVSKYIWLMIR
jgi:hypothetical protein